MPFCTSLGAVFEADENKYESRRPKIILDRFRVHTIKKKQNKSNDIKYTPTSAKKKTWQKINGKWKW